LELESHIPASQSSNPPDPVHGSVLWRGFFSPDEPITQFPTEGQVNAKFDFDHPTV
jgi:hypothetical protein